MSPTITDLAAFLRRSHSLVVLTGAGVSTESGIPDFRSPGGVWTRYDPREMTFQRYVESAEVRAMSWAMRREFFAAGARPNAAHRAIAALEAAGRCIGVITQNIDGLHQEAGSRQVVEVHGTARRVSCIGAAPTNGEPDGCGWEADTAWAFRRLDLGDDDPRCPTCGGLVKSATISFGQAMDPTSFAVATRLLDAGDALLVVGSSLQVHPVAGMPYTAAVHGAEVAILNDEPTPLDDMATVVARGAAGTLLPSAVAAAGIDGAP